MSLTAALLAAVLTWRFGVLTPERLVTRDFGSLLFAGAFGLLVGTLMFRFWRLGEKSGHYFRAERDITLFEGETLFVGNARASVALGKNEGEAFDLGPRAQQVLCVGVALLVGLASIDARSIEMMERFRRGLSTSSASYCPEGDTKPAADDPNAPGCELIRRAYALGYAKDLGDCGVTKARATAAICTLRQRDEPFAHYAWRLLEGFGDTTARYAHPDYWGGLKSDFDARLERLDSIRGAQREVLSSAPHSAHHIWVNLPDPGTGSFGENCADRYRELPQRPAPQAGDKAASQVFEHVLAQLLFETRYEPPAAYCREVTIHWGAAESACRRLSAAPEEFLAESGALPSVRAVLERWRVGRDLEARGKEKSQRTLDPRAFVSFSCWVEKPGATARWSGPVKLDGLEFTAEELGVAPSPAGSTLYVDRYDSVATLLTRGFHYGALLSEAALEQGAGEGLEPTFSAKDFRLSRLFGLEAVDLYLSPGWISKRQDLLEVYPYQLHLKNYVKVFRGQYRRERGRL